MNGLVWTRRRFLKSLGAIPAAGIAQSLLPADTVGAQGTEIGFSEYHRTAHGDWWAHVRFSPNSWQPQMKVNLEVFLHVEPPLLPSLAGEVGFPVEQVQMLLTAERCFGPDGLLRLTGDERMSTLLTPTGLAIEGGNTGAAISKYTGSRYRNAVDVLKRVPARDIHTDTSQWVQFLAPFTLPADTPPGIYRLRFDFGIVANRRSYSLNGESFAYRPREPQKNVSAFYSPTVACNGNDVAGNWIDATQIRRRIYWVLLWGYNSNGYYGVVADEDKDQFALSDRHIIPDEVILPLGPTYNLEPEFRADVIDLQRNIRWALPSGELSIQVTDPSGKTADLGTAGFKDLRNGRPTTGNRAFTAWRPAAYGRYSVVAKGWIADRYGNRYEGGGTYQFWIGKRMTMGTATFQGQPYPVGARYGRDLGFAPAVPADVTVKVDLYPSSDVTAVRSLTYRGTATPGGIFGAAQGMKPFALDAPGEYHAHVLATHTDPEGHLWVCSMRHAGVVYPTDTPILARGKKVKVRGSGKLIERGDTHFEGYVNPGDNFRNLDHIDFPYNAGDVLLIASEGDGANKIEPVLIYENKGSTQPYDTRLQPIGGTNLRITTSNGMSPHQFPEYITDMAYYYGAAPRPGFMSRFLVGEDGVRAPYWPTSATNFGGQIGATSNGDIPGTIYRLLGGVVLRPKGGAPAYAGYMASAFILPKGTNNNRVVAPGAEDLLGADGTRRRFFLASSLRPGMVYETGTALAPAFQIDPILPVNIVCRLYYGGEVVKEWSGKGDAGGSFAGSERVTLERPGLYLYTVQCDWEGRPGRVPGLPEEGGHIYVIEKERPAGATRLRLGLKNQQTFKVDEGLTIEGKTNGETVYFAAVTPGVVVDQGSLAVEAGKFVYRFDPAAVNQRVPLYDTVNVRTGRKELGRIIHLTFLAQESTADGTPYHSWTRVVLRGATAIYTS